MTTLPDSQTISVPSVVIESSAWLGSVNFNHMKTKERFFRIQIFDGKNAIQLEIFTFKKITTKQIIAAIEKEAEPDEMNQDDL